MRSLLPLAALAALTFSGCAIEIDPIFTCDQLPSDACVDDAHPVDFHDGDERLAVGGELTLPVLILEGTAVEFTSDRPDLLEVIRVDDAGPVVRAIAVGRANVLARSAGRIVTSRPMEVAAIASIDFRFDGSPDDDALTELAALPGASEGVRLVARDLNDLTAGRRRGDGDRRGHRRGHRGVHRRRRGARLGFFTAPRSGFLVGVRTGATGTGTLVARVDGVEIATLPITIVPAATTVALTVASPSTAAGWFQFAGLSGTDDRGVPVAGLVGDFTVSPSTLASIDDPRAGEAFIRALAAGEVTVTATLPDRTLTTTFTIVP
jgi:hypothetical protein